MNLTEACKLAKNIENFKYSLAGILSNRNYTTSVVEVHNRSAAVEGAKDETSTREVERPIDITVEEAVYLLGILMEKKAILSDAIENAKHNVCIDVNGRGLAYDSAVEYNKSLRNVVIAYLSRANSLKASNVKTDGIAYKLDAEGKQTRYVYEKEIQTTLTFDSKETRAKEKEYRKLANEVSTAIEEAKLATKIDIDLGIDINDTLEDVIAKFIVRETVDAE